MNVDNMELWSLYKHHCTAGDRDSLEDYEDLGEVIKNPTNE